MLTETLTLPFGTPEPVSAVTARPVDARWAFDAGSGTRDYASLPFVCRTGCRWSGTSTAHCGACHETFSGIGPFDRHRRGKPGDDRYPPGGCYYPGDTGLVLIEGRAYRCWGTTPTAGDQAEEG